jgi:hypothetical protein
MEWKDVVSKLAPTVATALGGPLAGAAVAALGDALGVSEPTQQKIADAISNGQLTSDQLAKLKELELQYQNDEKERGFKYEELAFKDRDSARRANVDGGVQTKIFWFSVWLIATCLLSELAVLYFGIPHGLPEIIVGRILGLLDGLALQATNYWLGTSNGSARKTDLISQGAK